VSATEELNRTSAEEPRVEKKRPLRVFLSYAHEDKKAQGLFRKNPMALESDGYITLWDDPNIKAGMEWRAEIDRELETMDVFVGLLTTNFHTSNFIFRDSTLVLRSVTPAGRRARQAGRPPYPRPSTATGATRPTACSIHSESGMAYGRKVSRVPSCSL
jgi:hypothetical protein